MPQVRVIAEAIRGVPHSPSVVGERRAIGKPGNGLYVYTLDRSGMISLRMISFAAFAAFAFFTASGATR
jgi:hypothetical protein